MRNVADQLFVLPVEFYLFLRVFLQPLAHVFKVFTQLRDLTGALRRNGEVQISLFDLSGGSPQFVQRGDQSPVHPPGQSQRRDGENQHYCCHHILHQVLQLRHHVKDAADDINSSVPYIGCGEIHLLDQRLDLSSQIHAVIRS